MTAGLAAIERQSQTKNSKYDNFIFVSDQKMSLILKNPILKINSYTKFEQKIMIGSRVMAEKLFSANFYEVKQWFLT